MVIGDFDVLCSAIYPPKADAKLVVDPNGVLPLTVPVQRVQLVAGRRFQVSKLNGVLDHGQLALGGTDQNRRKSFRAFPLATASVFLSLNERIMFLFSEAHHGVIRSNGQEKYHAAIRSYSAGSRGPDEAGRGGIAAAWGSCSGSSSNWIIVLSPHRTRLLIIKNIIKKIGIDYQDNHLSASSDEIPPDIILFFTLRSIHIIPHATRLSIQLRNDQPDDRRIMFSFLIPTDRQRPYQRLESCIVRGRLSLVVDGFSISIVFTPILGGTLLLPGLLLGSMTPHVWPDEPGETL